jgi:hypothetical protein
MKNEEAAAKPITLAETWRIIYCLDFEQGVGLARAKTTRWNVCRPSTLSGGAPGPTNMSSSSRVRVIKLNVKIRVYARIADDIAKSSSVVGPHSERCQQVLKL